MNWKGWSAIGGSIVAALTGVATATGAIGDIGGKVREIAGVATVEYVDAELKKLAGDFAPMIKQLNSLSALSADQAVRNLQGDVDMLARKLADADALLRALPGNPTLTMQKDEIQRQMDAAKDDLAATRCARLKITTGVDVNCKSRF